VGTDCGAFVYQYFLPAAVERVGGQRLPFLVHCGTSQIEAVDGICQMGTNTIKLLLI